MQKTKKRKKRLVHEEILENWHLEGHVPGSRQWKLILMLAAENEFNDPWTNVMVTDHEGLFCESIGY